MGTDIAGLVIDADQQRTWRNMVEAQSRADRELKREQFAQTRGSEGNAVLPMITTAGGLPWEREVLWPSLTGAYEFLSGRSAGQIAAEADKSIKAYEPARLAGREIVFGAMGPQYGQKILANAKPVWDARLAAGKQSALEMISQANARSRAAQAARGFSGDSSTEALTRYAGYKAAGDQTTQALEQNLKEERDYRNMDAAQRLQLALQNPWDAMLQQDINYGQMPYRVAADYYSMIPSVLAPINIGAAQPIDYDPINIPQPKTLDIAGAGEGFGNLMAYFQRRSDQNADYERMRKEGYGGYGGYDGMDDATLSDRDWFASTAGRI